MVMRSGYGQGSSPSGLACPMICLEVVERAATLHDIGKADARFQRWLDPRCESGPLLAKSDAPRHRWEAMRVSSGWPRGGRHEDLSARLVRAWLTQTPDWGSPLQRDLLVHLVVSHHGKGRPLVPPARDGTTEAVGGVVDGVSVTADSDLAKVDWEQPGRFRRLQGAARAVGAGAVGGHRHSGRSRCLRRRRRNVRGHLMHVFACPGLPAAWVNAWLAAIGTTVVDPRIRLHWTAEDSPVAALSSADLDPVEALVESWPNATFLRELPIAEQWNGAGEVKRKVSVDQFIVRSRAARGHPQAWTLSSTMTDLSIDANGKAAHAPFDPAGPGTTKWLHHRVLEGPRTHRAGVCGPSS